MRRTFSASRLRPTSLHRPGAGYRLVAGGTNGPRAESSARIDIQEPIGGWFGVDSAMLVRDLATLDATQIDLHINSEGGDVFDGLAIYEALLAHPANITVHVQGLAASAASFIAQAGDEIIISPNSLMMIHEAHGGVYGPPSDMFKMGELLNKVGGSLADLYAERCGGSADDWHAAMVAETWYDAEEAVAAGLATKVRASTRASDDGNDDSARNAARVDVQSRAERIGAARERVRSTFEMLAMPKPDDADDATDSPDAAESAPVVQPDTTDETSVETSARPAPVQLRQVSVSEIADAMAALRAAFESHRPTSVL